MAQMKGTTNNGVSARGSQTGGKKQLKVSQTVVKKPITGNKVATLKTGSKTATRK